MFKQRKVGNPPCQWGTCYLKSASSQESLCGVSLSPWFSIPSNSHLPMKSSLVLPGDLYGVVSTIMHHQSVTESCYCLLSTACAVVFGDSPPTYNFCGIDNLGLLALMVLHNSFEEVAIGTLTLLETNQHSNSIMAQGTKG